MQIVTDTSSYVSPRPSVCAIGTFDGVHVGHQALVRRVVADATARGAQSVVVTFHPHPRAVLGRGDVPYLTLPDEKAELMAELGVDVLMVFAFTQDTIRTTADEFVRWLVGQLKMVSLWAGADFALGNKRQGDIAFLSARGCELGFVVNVVEQVQLDGAPALSSTAIREALARGDVLAANAGLGRAFSVMGELVNPRAVRVPKSHALPSAGAYPVFACGALNTAWVSNDDDIVKLANPIEDCARVVIEFV